MSGWSHKYLGKQYKTEHPCLALVLDVLEHEYGIKAPMHDVPLSLQARRALAYQLLASTCRRIDPADVKDGDIVLLRPAHVGILLNTQNVVHVPDCHMGVVVENLKSPWLVGRIEGFYRPEVKSHD